MSGWRAWRGNGKLLRGYSDGSVITIAPPSPPESVQGATIVSRSGSDTTGNGTLEAPYRSLRFASAGAKPGDTIYVRGGYYDVVSTDTYVTLAIQGTEAAPITISSYPGEWAIFDGINHAWHPRSFEDGNADKTPYTLVTRCRWVNWRNMEQRNGVGGGWDDVSIDTTFEGIVCRNNNAQAMMVRGRRTDVGYSLFSDTYNIVQGGNGGDGFLFASAPATLEAAHPGEPSYDSEFNRIHHSISRLTSDDGITTAHSLNCVTEYCIALDPGVVPSGTTTGMGTGYKVGLGYTVNSGNIIRYNIAIGTLGRGYNTNGSQGILLHNNLAIDCNGGFTLVAFGDPNLGDNTAYNNIVVDITGNVVRTLDDAVTTHTHNAGSTGAWANGSLGTDNIGLTALELAYLSKDPTHADFAKLGAGSLARGHGIVVLKATDTDLGPIPYGETFAGGWDWRALLAAHPSVREWPMPQT